jgi:nitrate/TMAO reductase-like tetraheme cytochrome c subunit
MRGMVWFVCGISAVWVLGVEPTEAQAVPVVRCENCHGERDFFTGGDSTLFVPAEIFSTTAHSGLACTDCHRGFEAGFPHSTESKVVSCETCHEQEGVDWAASIHAPNATLRGDAPKCVDCHGIHEVFRASDRQSPTYALNVASLCGRCHADPSVIGSYFATADKAQARTAVAQYFETVHGHALTVAGLTVSATCNDCHRAHKVLPADSAESSVNRRNIPETCGACHEGIIAVYEASAHGAAQQNGRANGTGHSAPMCVDCHSAHGIVRADEPVWHLGVVEECGTCHEELYQTYLETYHGKVTRLGSTLAATCSDCHTPHNMRSADDPSSSVNSAHLVETCSACHQAANANFVQYRPHADPRQGDQYPVLHWTWLFMTSLLIGVMVFFGIHTVLWVTRLTIDHVRAGKAGTPS